MALKDGLVSLWEMEEASGTRFDSHGSNDLTDVNTVGSATGKLGDAGSYISANSEMLEKTSIPADLRPGDFDWTYICWFRTNASLDTGATAGWGTNASTRTATFGITTTGLSARIWDSGLSANDFAFIPLASLTSSTWYFFTIRYNAATDELVARINGGSNQVFALASVRTGAATNIQIGNGVGYAFNNSLIDQTAWFNEYKSDSDLDAIFNSGDGLAYSLWDEEDEGYPDEGYPGEVTQVGTSIQAVWNVMSEVDISLQAVWNVGSQVTSSLELQWSVMGSVSQSLQAIWNIDGQSSTDLDIRWNVEDNSVSTSLDVRWNVENNEGGGGVPNFNFTSESFCLSCLGASVTDVLRFISYSKILKKLDAMAATDTQTLLSEGNCFICYGASVVQAITLALQARIVKKFDANADVTPQSLIDYAKCFNCASDASLVQMMELSLLDKMSNLIT